MQRKPQVRPWLRFVLPGVSQARWMSKSKFYTAGFVTRTCTKPGMNGTTQFIPACRAMRLSAASAESAPALPSSGPVKHQGSFNFILDAVSAQHDINAYLSLLKLDGTLTLVGAPEQPLPVAAFNLLLPRRNFAGSAIGGIAETQEMLDFCATHRIVSDIELIPIQKINEAWDRLLKQEVRYRFVIDMASLKS